MATVRPFRGILFDPTRVPDASLVTCPPYDVISPAERTMLYERHPYNIVRIVSGRDETGDGERDNKYIRAAGFFRSWMWEGVLREDPAPALYVYRQAFSDPSGQFRRVWGLVGTIALDDDVLAHEQTMPGPKADRLALMEAIPANLSPIYALYREECAGGISAELQAFAGEAPVADFADDEQTRHTVWSVHDTEFHERVGLALAPCPILIADGHHRFETAKRYHSVSGPLDANEARRAAESARRTGADFTMALLVDAGVQPVCILPYHRLVLRCDEPDPLPVLERGCEVEKLGPVDAAGAVRLGLELWQQDRPGVFVAFVDGEAYRLTARDASPGEIPAAVLKRVALEPLGARFAEEALAFTPRAEEVASEVAAGRAVCGFLTQPVDVHRVWELASKGAQMPEKSTYFHPKPRDGIVMRLLG